MTTADRHDDPAAPPRQLGYLLALFTATTFLSATLLFSIQPMFAKMALPILGGSPSVWAVALCFFQGALLVGYGYAHLLNRYADGLRAGLVHLGLYLVALIAVPISIPAGWSEPPQGDPSLWQLAMFTVAVGLPFVAVAANAPLMQAWFSRTAHAQARDPYFLYAASNLGSLLALLGYPLLLEPAFGVSQLSRMWAVGFVLLGLSIAACIYAARSAPGVVATRVREGDADAPTGATATDDPAESGPSTATDVRWVDRARWIGLALVPSALLTAFTTHVSTDIASAPLIWVVPLALYLLTFVLTFRERPLVPAPVMLALHLVAVVLALLQLSQSRHESAFIAGGLGLAAFFLSAMVAHRTLYEARPAPSHLTEFYLWMSFGGVLGGLFAALVAPRIFSEVYEYPLLLALTIACRPGALRIDRSDGSEILRLWLTAATGALLIYWLPMVVRGLEISTDPYGVATWLVALLSLAAIVFYFNPPRQVIVALLMFAAVSTLPSGVKRGAAERSFFGVYRVAESWDGEFNILTHGTTLHGAQRVREKDGTLVVDTTPATYYHPKSPMARSVGIMRSAAAAEGRKPRIGIIGLGTGSLSCYAQAGDSWRFFEIDQTVVDIARDPVRFSFLHNCQPNADIVIGDARLTLAKDVDASYDLLIVDAFSSDAVPVHLMTAEALQLYRRKLRPGGVVALHISNRYLDLDSVVAATSALVPGFGGFLLSDDASDGTYATSTSTVAVLSNDPTALAPFRQAGSAVINLDARGLRGWTDDFSDVLGPILIRLRQ